jgi:hypothetical protein
MTTKKNKNNNKADDDKLSAQRSPHSGSYDLLSQIDEEDISSIGKPSPAIAELTNITNEVVASDEGRAVADIFSRLDVAKAFALVRSLPITRKLEGVLDEFTADEKTRMAPFITAADQEYHTEAALKFQSDMNPHKKHIDVKPLMRDLVSPIDSDDLDTFPHKNTFLMHGENSGPTVSGTNTPFSGRRSSQNQGHRPPTSAFHPTLTPHISSTGFHFPPNQHKSTTGPAPYSAFHAPAQQQNMGYIQQQPFANYSHAPTPVLQQFQQGAPSHHNQSSTQGQQFQQGAPSHHNQSSTQGQSQYTGLPTGFSLRPARSSSNYKADCIIISRYNRGPATDTKGRAKVQELCTKPIQPLLDSSKIKSLLTSDAPYDISEDASHWQDGLRSIWTHAVAFDFKHILLIPDYFNPNNSSSISPNARYFNAVLDYDKLTDQQYFEWQYFLRSFGNGHEIVSDQWFEEKLIKSLGPTLLAEVRSDYYKLDDNYKGSISLLRIIINRMVQSNQELQRAMEDYIKTFDIRAFPGEDVSEASLRLKAIARSLGKDNLPTDIIHRVLEGFSLASTPGFQSLCHYKESMLSTGFMSTNMRHASLYTQLVDVLHNLELKFIDLRSGRHWLGIGHGTATTKSAFNATEDDDSTDDDTDDYAIYKVAVGKAALPFDEWVKDKTCHHCNKLGHIRGEQCPKYVSDVFAGWVPPPKKRSTKPFSKPCRFPHTSHTTNRTRQSPDNHQRSYAAADIIASDESMSPPSSTNTATTDAYAATHSAFLTALGCPKE